jgi:hypothetical protein
MNTTSIDFTKIRRYTEDGIEGYAEEMKRKYCLIFYPMFSKETNEFCAVPRANVQEMTEQGFNLFW